MTELDVFYPLWFPSPIMKTKSDSDAYKLIEERTNVKINFVQPAAAAVMENFNLMFSSGDLTDGIVCIRAYYAGGISKYIDDGFILNLRDYTEFMPNFNKILQENKVIFKDLVTDEGYFPDFQTLSYVLQPEPEGLAIRQDWLDDVGYQGLPETYDDWTDVLRKLKDHSTKAPLYFSNGSTIGVDSSFAQGFGAGEGFLLEGGKNIVFSPVTDNFRQYLQLMAGWYNEGLIDKDFATLGNYQAVYGRFAEGDWAASRSIYTFIDNTKAASTNPNFNMVMVNNPKVTAGTRTATAKVPAYNNGINATVSATGANPELMIRYFDFFFSEEGALIANFGVEGVSYTMVDGKPQLTELITKNPENMSMTVMLDYHCYFPTWPFLYDYRRELVPGALSEKAFAAPEIWDKNRDMYGSYAEVPEGIFTTLPASLSMSVEESAKYTSAFNDINTYVAENIAAFITGQKSFDEWDSYVSQIKSMGLQDCIDIQTAAYERYLKR
jgi:putative aldouronate transport system substrate-binding protein